MGKLDPAWQAFQRESFNVLNADIENLLRYIGAHAAIERRALLELATSKSSARISPLLLKYDVMGVVYCVPRSRTTSHAPRSFSISVPVVSDERIKNISAEVPPLRALAAGSPPSRPPSR